MNLAEPVPPFIAGPGCALQRDLVVESTGDPGRRGGCAHAAHLECNASVGEPCGASASLRGHVLVLPDQGNHPARHARVSELDTAGVDGPVVLDEGADLRRFSDRILGSSRVDVTGVDFEDAAATGFRGS